MKLLLVLLMLQHTDSTQAQLQARGLPADLAAQVTAVVRQTNADGLPGRAIADKAVEGFFKHVPPPRIIAAVRDLSQRLGRARTELRAGGIANADGSIIAGAADASAQGISRGDQVDIIRSSTTNDAAAAGLSVSAALVVQGLDPGLAARLVKESYQHGRSIAQVLDLPAAARALQVRGVASTEIGRQLLDGISATGSVTGHAGAVVKPTVPPIRVP